MSNRLARARLLIAQSRPADAEREVLLALSEQPEDPDAFALLAISRNAQDKRREALVAAQSAIGLAPTTGHFHGISASILFGLERLTDAREAIQEALRLSPEDEDNFALLAAIELTEGNWLAAVEAAEHALALSPEHINAANYRAMALLRLGRKEEAAAAIASILRLAPNSAFTHSTLGWNSLHRNDPSAAQKHFREALRLDPNSEHARHGMLEALKARHTLYRVLLAYILWLGRQSGRRQIGVLVTIFFLVAQLYDDTATHPWIWSPLIALGLFAYLSWTCQVAFNLLLRFDHFGRHVLNRDQRIGAVCYGATAGAALGALVAGSTLAQGRPFLVIGLLLLTSSVFVATIARSNGRNRWILGAFSSALTGLGFVGCYQFTKDSAAGTATLQLFFTGFFWLQIIALFFRH